MPFSLRVFLVLLIATQALFSQNFNIQFLGNWNLRSSPSGVYSPYSACWGYVAPGGREYALLGSTLGTSIIDITDAPTLVEVAFIPGPSSNWREMKTYDRYAYIVSDQEDGVVPNGVQIVDLTIPDSARVVKTYVWQDTTNSVVTPISRTHTISIESKYLYLNGGNFFGIRILDLTDPTSPLQAGKYSGPYFHDSYIRNDTIYAAAIYGEGIDIIDARNKANPTRIKLITYPGAGTHNTWTTTDSKYVLTTDEINSTPKTLKIWDIRNIQSPTKVAELASVKGSDTAIVHNVVVKDNLAYVAWYTAGLKIVDVSNPASPVVVGSYDTYPASDAPAYAGNWGVYPFFPSGKIIACDMQTGLYVLRYSGPAVSVPAGERVPGEFVLLQNYPNPFNPSTRIPFTLRNRGSVKLTVHNLLGVEVATLLDGEMSPGSHSVVFEAPGLASGVYLIRLQSPEGIRTRKMTLLR